MSCGVAETVSIAALAMARKDAAVAQIGKERSKPVQISCAGNEPVALRRSRRP